jgi:hypothetical protein
MLYYEIRDKKRREAEYGHDPKEGESCVKLIYWGYSGPFDPQQVADQYEQNRQAHNVKMAANPNTRHMVIPFNILIKDHPPRDFRLSYPDILVEELYSERRLPGPTNTPSKDSTAISEKKAKFSQIVKSSIRSQNCRDKHTEEMKTAKRQKDKEYRRAKRKGLSDDRKGDERKKAYKRMEILRRARAEQVIPPQEIDEVIRDLLNQTLKPGTRGHQYPERRRR